MKKTLLILFNVVGLMSTAQVVINKSNLYVSTGEEGTLELPGLISNPSRGANQTWNLSAITSGNLDYFNFKAGTSASFPGAVVKLNEVVSIGGAFDVPATRYYGSVDEGYGVVGISISQTTVPIDAITGTPGDKITFMSQDDVQNAYAMPFPLTYQGKYKTVNRLAMDGKITVAVLSLNNADFAYVEHTTFEDTVTGWGMLRLPHPIKSSTRDYEVLRVDRKVTIIDSVYINGVAASPALLAQFGLQQGKTTVYYRSQFFSPNSKWYMLRINYQSDASFTTPYNAFCSANTNALGDESLEMGKRAIWPNPINGNSLNIHWDAAKQASQIQILDMQGRLVLNTFMNAQGAYALQLPNHLPSGFYTVQVLGDEGVLVREKVLNP